MYLSALAIALLLTVTVESAAAMLFRPRRGMALSFALGSLATNPLLNVCFWLSGGSMTVLYVGELAAIALEAWVCRMLTGASWRKSLAVSVAVNILSYTLGKVML